jgi:hypothetical protein
MRLVDVNVLVYAHRAESDRHADFREWLEALVNGDTAFAVPSLCLSGFLRVVTHPRVFAQPSSLDDAMTFVEQIRSRPTYVDLQPGPRHFQLFTDLCRRTRARGNLIPDAYLAAIAIEAGAEWITTDRDFARFPGLTWAHPLE